MISPSGKTKLKTAIAVGALAAVAQQTATTDVDGAAPDSGQHRQLGQTMAASQYGWDGRQWDCLETLWQNESNWDPGADNPTSTATGIPQALASAHDLPAGYRTNARVQIEWGLDYIDGRYGTPCNAWEAWQSRSPHWY